MLRRNLDPQEVMRRILAGWYWIAIFAILGGTIGFLISLIKAPQFQSTAEMDIGYDFNRMVPLNPSYQQRAYSRVRDLVLSDDTLQGAVALLNEDNSYKSFDDLSELRVHLRLGDYNDHWELIVLGEEPADAAAMANAWAESTVSALESALFHSWRVTQLQSDFYDLSCVFKADVYGGDATPLWICQHDDNELDPDLLIEELVDEVQQSRGILPALSFSILTTAYPPNAPVLWERGMLIIASTIVGLIMGVIFAMTRENTREDSKLSTQTQGDQNREGRGG